MPKPEEPLDLDRPLAPTTTATTTDLVVIKDSPREPSSLKDLDALLIPDPTDSPEVEKYKELLTQLVTLYPNAAKPKVLPLLQRFPPSEETDQTLSATGLPTHRTRILALGDILYDTLCDLESARM